MGEGNLRMALPVILFNANAGGQSAAREDLERLLGETGWRAELRPIGSDCRAAAESALSHGASAVVAAGGDGTVSAVAGVLAGGATPLGVLPLGTLNHFARDLGIPLDLPSALRVLAAGHTRQVDVAQVNGRRFINNSSIGLYPHIVADRDRQRQQLGRSKWFAMSLAVLSAIGRYPMLHVVLDAAGQTLGARTPLVFVGNNRYDMNLLNLGARPALDRGELSLYLIHAPRRLSLLALTVRMLFGRLRARRDFRQFVLPNLRIETRRRHLRVAMDGEVERMRPPLEYRILPGALKVIVPGP